MCVRVRACAACIDSKRCDSVHQTQFDFLSQNVDVDRDPAEALETVPEHI